MPLQHSGGCQLVMQKGRVTSQFIRSPGLPVGYREEVDPH